MKMKGKKKKKNLLIANGAYFAHVAQCMMNFQNSKWLGYQNMIGHGTKHA